MIKQIRKSNRKFLIDLVLILIVSLVFIIGGRYFSSPPLRSDDWNWIVWPTVFDPLKPINLMDRRPLFAVLLSLLNSIFGLHIQWYYVVNWLLLYCSGFIVYLIVKKAFPEKTWLALPVALVFLIYPVNYARTWLVILNNTYALLLALICIFLLVVYRSSGKLYQIILANLIFLISLLTYEAGFGIVILAGLLLLFLTKNKLRWGFLSILLSGVVFLAWRSLIQPNLFNLQDFYLQNVSLNLKAIGSRTIQGLFIFMFNWIGPLLSGFGDLKYWVFVGIGLLVLLSLLILIFIRTRKLKLKSPDLLIEKVNNIKSLLKVMLIGVLFWFAGYIPVIFLWQPTFYGDSSRVNFAAIPGAALIVVALIAALITFLTKVNKFPNRTLIYALVPLILLGMVYQIHSQNQRVKVWEINKQFWQEMFVKVPNLERGTKLITVIPEYQELQPFELLPFRGDWEAESALDVLYNDSDLFAEYYYLDNPDQPDNWVPESGDYSKYLFVYFDPEVGTLNIIQDPVTALGLSVQAEAYDPVNRIIEYTPNVGKYRGLVD